MPTLSPPYPPPLLASTTDEHAFAILSALHTSLTGIYKPIFLLQALLEEQIVPPPHLFAAHVELSRLNTLYTAVLARISRDFGPETANAASTGVHEQSALDLTTIDRTSLIPIYPLLAALLIPAPIQSTI